MSTSSRKNDPSKVSARAVSGGGIANGSGIASERVAVQLEDLGRASALLQALAEGDGLKRMSDEELMAYVIVLAAVARAFEALFSMTRAEMARRIKEESSRLSRALDS